MDKPKETPRGSESEDKRDADDLSKERQTSSEVLIEQFLADSGRGSPREPAGEAAPDWDEAPLPEGHKSGFVALIGRPNVGKSTLLNRLVGEKVAIVSSKPQTTRNRLRGILTEPDYQIVFVDTPGIHQKPPHRINEIMIKDAVAAIPDADVILFVVDVAVYPRSEDAYIADLLRAHAGASPVIFTLNKVDRLDLARAEARIKAFWALLPDYADSMPVSALEGTNVDALLDHILMHLPEGPRYYPGGQITDQAERQIAAELIREALFRYTHQEIPHSAAVLVEDYHSQENGVFRVGARIWVDRPSQKPIVIGRQGQKLKQIGIAARRELERFIGGQVFLDLWVKVKPGWRDDMARLRELGH